MSSLGNFVFDLAPPFLGPVTRQTMVVMARVGRGGVSRLAFHPGRINAAGQPEPLPTRSVDFEAAVRQMRRMCGPLRTRLTVQGNEVVARAA